MKTLLPLFTACALAFPALAQAPKVRPETPLITSAPATVTAQDFEANLLRIPPEMRPEARASLDRVSTIVDNIYVLRRQAREAKAAGLLEDPLVKLRGEQILEAYQAKVFSDHYELSLKYPELEARAREIHLAEGARFRTPERLEFEHVLVSFWARTREMALARAKEARGKVAGGRSLLEIANEYSDDPSLKANGGRIGPVTPPQIDMALVEALRKLKPGELSEPVQTRSGYHLMRLIQREEPRPRSFEDSKAQIMEEERARLVKKALEAKQQAYRMEAGVKVDSDAMRALVSELPREEIERQHRRAQESAPKK